MTDGTSPPEPAKRDRSVAQAPHVEQGEGGGDGRRVMAIRAAIAAAIVAALALSFFLPRLLTLMPGKPPLSAQGVVRATVTAIRSGAADRKVYEQYFQDQAVAQAIADGVRKGRLPKGLDIARLAAQTGSDAATVTVRWTVKRPLVKENGTAFALRRVGGRWLIVDAVSRQVR